MKFRLPWERSPMNARRSRILTAAEQAIDHELRLEAARRVAALTPAEREAALREVHEFITTHYRHRLRAPIFEDPDEWMAQLRPSAAIQLLELAEYGKLKVDLDVGTRNGGRARWGR